MCKDHPRREKRVKNLHLRVRGPNDARDEFNLAATTKNLRKMFKLISMPIRKALIGATSDLIPSQPLLRNSASALVQKLSYFERQK